MLVNALHKHPTATLDDLLEFLRQDTPASLPTNDTLFRSVWHRMTTQFPHMFAIANARGTLHTLDLDGAPMLQSTDADEDFVNISY